jgi:predicted transcriptional regulator
VALRRGQRHAPLRPWLFRIAHNEAISAIRRRAADATHGRLTQPLTADSPEEHADRNARLSALLEDLAELPERARSALVMRELGDLSHAEIGQSLGITPAAAKQAVFEARRGLLELAEGRGMRCEEICRTLSDGDRRALRGRRVRAHLRACRDCAAFATAIRTRQDELRGMAPVLAPAAAASIFAAALGHLPGSRTVAGAAGRAGVRAAASLRPAGSGAGASTSVVAAGVTSKLAVGVAVVVSAAAGTGAVAVLVHDNGSPAPAVAATAQHTLNYALLTRTPAGWNPVRVGASPLRLSRRAGTRSGASAGVGSIATVMPASLARASGTGAGSLGLSALGLSAHGRSSASRRRTTHGRPASPGKSAAHRSLLARGGPAHPSQSRAGAPRAAGAPGAVAAPKGTAGPAPGALTGASTSTSAPASTGTPRSQAPTPTRTRPAAKPQPQPHKKHAKPAPATATPPGHGHGRGHAYGHTR